MKILHVITSLQTGGAEKLITEIVPMLRKRGHDVDVALFDGRDTPFKKELASCGCRIYSLSEGGSVYNPLLIFKLRKIVKAYDLVHTHNTAAQLFGAISTVGLNIKLVTTEHSSNNRRRDKRYIKPIDRWMYRRYDKIISISEVAEKNLKEYLGEDDKRFVTVHNGVNIDRFKNASPNPLLRAGSTRCVIVMVAGFRYEKDQDTLIKALSLLPADQYELWLVGDGVRRPILEQLCAEYGVADRVKFWGIRNDIPEILHTADIVVMSSHFEGLSLSSIEGMSVGKPFVASDVPGLREVTQGAGLLFRHSDIIDLKDKIIEIMVDKNKFFLCAHKCLDRSLEYDIIRTVDNYSLIYYQIVSS